VQYKWWWHARPELVVNVHLAVHIGVKAMLELYYHCSPNPTQAALAAMSAKI